MKFNGKLDPQSQSRVEQCNQLLVDPQRLLALKQTKLMDSPPEKDFDRLATLSAKLLKVPLTIISLVSDKKQFFKAGYGLPAPFDTLREIPIDGSICRYTLKGEAIIADSAASDPLLKHHPATGPWGIGAFIAIPMILPDGLVLGAFCAVGPKARHWTEEDIEIMQELTASVMTEINLRRQIDVYENEKRLRETFVAALTHDLRTPLAAVKLNAQLIRRKVEEPSPIQHLSDRILKNVERADSMVRDLLDADRIKSGKQVPVEKEACSLLEILESSILDLQELHGSRVVIHNECGSLLGLWDREGIRRIMDNLISNAIKYGNSNSNISINLSKIQNEVLISIHNEGEPIPPKDLAQLFEPFHRTKSAIEGGQRGWGIGLSLVKAIAEANGGQVSAESSPLLGTTFFVRLPGCESTPPVGI